MTDIGLRARLDLRTFNVQVQEYKRAVQDMVKANTSAATASATAADDAKKAQEKLVKSWQDSAKNVKDSGGGIIQALKNIGAQLFQTGEESKKAAEESSRAWDDFRFSWNRVLEIVSGVFVIDVWRSISRGLREVRTEAIQAVSDFQRLQIQLQALAAIDYAEKFGGEVVDAFDKVVPQAKELLGWIREIAVTTPFSVETLAQAVAYGQAFGFSVEQSKRLTIATGNFTAGMGLTNEQLERILYNFGQMLASGRILGRELRDLANNFVPINSIIQEMADEAGVSFNEMRDQMSKGLVPAGQFVSKFIEIAEERFPDAMERMSRTIAGVRQNFIDFIHTVIGLELLGPTAEVFAGTLADAINRALSPEVLRTFSAMGFALRNSLIAVAQAVTGDLLPAMRSLLQAFGLSVPTAMDFASAILYVGYVLKAVISGMAYAIQAVADFIRGLIKVIATPLTKLQEWGFEWGANFIMSFAEGMAKAVVYVITVITAIAKAITGMLKSNSPPKILPRLRDWGRNAMLEYLKGWGSADFGILNDVFSTLASYVRSLAYKMEPIQIAKTLLAVRKEVLKAVQEIRKFGSVTAATLQKIGSLTQLGSGAVKDYITAMLEVATLTARMENIDKILDFKVGVPSNIFGNVVDSIEELIEAAAKVPGELGDAVRKYVQALADTTYYDELLQSLEDRLTAITDVADEEERLKEINEALASGLLTSSEYQKLAREKESIEIKQRIRTLEGERDAAKDTMEDQRDIIRSIADEEMALAEERLAVAKSTIEVMTENNQLLSEYIKLLESLKDAGGAGGIEDIMPEFDFSGIEEDVSAMVDDLEANIEEAIAALEEDIKARVDAFIKAILSPFTAAAQIISPYLTPMFDAIQAAFDGFLTGGAWDTIKIVLNGFYADIVASIENIRTFFEQQGPELAKVATDFVNGVLEAFGIEVDVEGLGEAAFGAVLGGITGLGDALNTFTSNLVTNGPTIVENLRSISEYITGTAIPNMRDAWKWFTEEALPAISDFGKFLIDNGPLIISILEGIVLVMLGFKALTFVGSLLASFGQTMLFIQIGLGFLNTILPTIIGLLGSGGLAGVLSSLLPILGPIAAIIGVISAVILLWNTNFAGFRDLMIEVGSSINEALAPALEELKPAFDDLKNSLKALTPVWNVLKVAVGTVVAFVVELLKVVVMLGGALITGLGRGFIMVWKTAMNAVSGIIKGLTVAFKGIIDFFTGLWELIVGIFTGDTGKITEAINKMAVGVLELVGGLVWGIWNAIVLVFGNILVFIGGFITGVIEFFRNLADKLINNSIITDMLVDIWNAFVEWFGKIIGNIGQWILDIIAAIIAKIPEWIQAGKDLIINFISGLHEKFFGTDGVIESVGKWISNTIDKIKEFFVNFVETGAELVSNLIQGISDMFFDPAEGLIAKILIWLGETVTKITSNETLQGWIDAGISLIDGIIKGLWQAASKLWEAVKDIIADALSAGEDQAGMGSPAEEWIPLGKSMIDGLVSGFRSGFPEASRTIQGYVASLTDMQNSIGSMFRTPNILAPGLNYSIGGAPGSSGQVVNIDRSIHVEMNPSYANYQSEAAVRHDLSAVLAIAGL